VSPLVLTLKAAPPQRLDLSPLLPHLLAGKSVKDIAAIDLATTRERLAVGDLFRIRAGSAEEIRLEGGSERFDSVGKGLQSGRIIVAGDVGIDAGRKMTGGVLVISGSAGPYAGSAMAGGRLEIGGNAGDLLAAPREGEIHGMSGGLFVLHGTAGERAGDRLRRGTILIEGDAGDWLGSRVIAGTLIVLGRAGASPGYLMRRGTIVLAKPPALSPTFVDCGSFASTFTAVFGRFIQAESRVAARLFKTPLRRFAGDMAVLGKGEIFVPV
jgi:formylmethanofuran dehydrogenase subunit C